MNWFDRLSETLLVAVFPYRAHQMGNDYLGAVSEIKRLRTSIKLRMNDRDFEGALLLVGTACLEYRRAYDLRERLMLTDQGRKQLLGLRSTYADAFEYLP